MRLIVSITMVFVKFVFLKDVISGPIKQHTCARLHIADYFGNLYQVLNLMLVYC